MSLNGRPAAKEQTGREAASTRVAKNTDKNLFIRQTSCSRNSFLAPYFLVGSTLSNPQHAQMEHGLNLFGTFCGSYPHIDKNFARHRNTDICILHVFCLVSKRGCKDVIEEVAKHLTSQHSPTERSCTNYTTPKIIIKSFFEKNCNLCTKKEGAVMADRCF